MLTHFNYQPRPNSSPHSLFARRGNLVKTRKRIWTISLFRRGARENCCRAPARFIYNSARAERVESLLWAAARDRDTAPDGTVLFVNKKNRKTDAASEGNANIVCKCRAARRNRVAYREQRPFTGFAEVARGSRRQREAKLQTDASHPQAAGGTNLRPHGGTVFARLRDSSIFGSRRNS